MTSANSTDILVVLCTCPGDGVAGTLGRILVQQRLAACVNVLDRVTSIYRWRGDVAEDTEALMVIKTTIAQYPRLESAIIAHHPYELPEIIAVPIERGFEQYLAWIRDSTF